jgi:hypothetical protein
VERPAGSVLRIIAIASSTWVRRASSTGKHFPALASPNDRHIAPLVFPARIKRGMGNGAGSRTAVSSGEKRLLPKDTARSVLAERGVGRRPPFTLEAEYNSGGRREHNSCVAPAPGDAPGRVSIGKAR